MSVFNIKSIRDHIIGYCGSPYWIATIKYSHSGRPYTYTSIIVAGKLNSREIKYSLDQYYGESYREYAYISVKYKQIYDKEDYITRHLEWEDEYACYCFNTINEFFDCGGRFYERYCACIHSQHYEELPYPDEEWDDVYPEWLYRIALYSHSW